MSPLLASLALLAVCWQPNVSRKVESNNYQNLGSYIVNAQPEVGKAIQASTGDEQTMEQAIALLDLMPNTLLGVGFAKSGALKKMNFLEEPFDYGAICEQFDPELPEKIKEILGAPTDKQLQQMKSSFNIDCARKPPMRLAGYPVLSAASLRKVHACFCDEDQGFYCPFAVTKQVITDAYASKNAPVPTPSCLSETVPDLLNSGSGALGAAWKDLTLFGPETLNYYMSDNVEAFSTTDQAAILCDAVNPAVEKALKAVYASNGAYWFAEIFMFANAFPQESTETGIDMSQLCRKKAVIENPYGKCFCKLDTGFTFCLYKVIAETFINQGILTCDKTDKTKQKIEKRAAALPNLALPKAKPDSKGPTGGAATSSLTIATLAAAALLLLRQ